MDLLIQSLEKFTQYPQNLIRHDVLSHNLKNYLTRLASQGSRLFDERQIAVDFLDFVCPNQEYRSNCVTTFREQRLLLREALRPGQSDPLCRYVFIHAPHSRASLRISCDMLGYLFSYYQVMPSFLDFVFPFGKQVFAQDFHFSGLREESRLDLRRKGIEITELGRSGGEIRLCYNLRSVERSSGQPDLPWSIRQSAVYHSFDIHTGQSLWINVKGNKLIKNRILEASAMSPLSKIQSRGEAFSASLATHLLLCDWSGENWRWYINDLENELQALTRNALATQVDKNPTPPSSPTPFLTSPRIRTGSFTVPSRTGTAQSPISPKTKSEPFSPVFPSRTTTLIECPEGPVAVGNGCHNHDKWAKVGFAKSQNLRNRALSNLGDLKSICTNYLRFWNWNGTKAVSSMIDTPKEKSQSTEPSTGDKIIPNELPPTLSEDGDAKADGNFTFGDLQRIQYIEEKAQEALLVLRFNAETLEELRQHYQYATSHNEFPSELKGDCQADLVRFDKCVLGVEKDLRMLQSRTETLLNLLANRKNLLNGILQYRSVKASEFFAKKAQISADHMEAMTIEMHDIAQKTKQETVSMRVITSVTLFFLPATFIATFMSTDILKFDQGTENFQLKGLKIYLALALPMTAVTFLAWYVIYIFAKKRGRSTSDFGQDDKYSRA